MTNWIWRTTCYWAYCTPQEVIQSKQCTWAAKKIQEAKKLFIISSPAGKESPEVANFNRSEKRTMQRKKTIVGKTWVKPQCSHKWVEYVYSPRLCSDWVGTFDCWRMISPERRVREENWADLNVFTGTKIRIQKLYTNDECKCSLWR